MAQSDKNIVITPNVGSSSADPKIVFSGADATTSAQNITLQVYPTNGGTVSFEGASGQILSIASSITGTLFSVNDISGIPSVEVLDSGLVKIAQYGGNVVLGTGIESGAKFQVSGAAQANNPTLGSAVGAGLFVTNSDPRYGLMVGVAGAGYSWAQVGRSDGTATAYDLRLQTMGGNVSIGNIAANTKLHVLGAISAGQNTNGTAVIDAYGGFAYYGCNTASNGLKIDGSGNITAASFSGAGTGLTGTASSLTVSTSLNSTYLYSTSHPGTYYISNAWDGVRWYITSNHGAPVRVGYADTAGSTPQAFVSLGGTSTAEIVRANIADNDFFRILVGGTASNAGYAEFATADDGNEPMYFRQYTGVFGSLVRTATILDGSGNTIFPGSVTSSASDRRLKANIRQIDNALSKVLAISGITYFINQLGNSLGLYEEGEQMGVIAQEILAVAPQAVTLAALDRTEFGTSKSGKNYLTVRYERLVPLLIEAIKEQQGQINELKIQLGKK